MFSGEPAMKGSSCRSLQTIFLFSFPRNNQYNLASGLSAVLLHSKAWETFWWFKSQKHSVAIANPVPGTTRAAALRSPKSAMIFTIFSFSRRRLFLWINTCCFSVQSEKHNELETFVDRGEGVGVVTLVCTVIASVTPGCYFPRMVLIECWVSNLNRVRKLRLVLGGENRNVGNAILLGWCLI